MTTTTASRILGITGHRPAKLGGYDAHTQHAHVRVLIHRYLDEHRPDRVITGMALGVDQWVAQACVPRAIPFVAAVPFRGQDRFWPEPARREYDRLLALADEIVIVSPGGYAAAAMHRRNAWIVDHCSTLLAVWDGSSGGTGSCVAYARSRGREIHVPPTRHLSAGGLVNTRRLHVWDLEDARPFYSCGRFPEQTDHGTAALFFRPSMRAPRTYLRHAGKQVCRSCLRAALARLRPRSPRRRSAARRP